MAMAEIEDKDTDFISQDDIDSLLSQAQDEELEAENAAAEEMLEDTEESDGESSSEPEPESDQQSTPSDAASDSESETDQASESSDTEPDADQIPSDIGADEVGEEISDRVILEDVPDEFDEPDEADEPGEPDEPDEHPTPKRKWKTKKLLIVASPVVLILCGVLGFVIVSSFRKPADDGLRTVQSFPIVRKEPEKKTESVKVLKEVLNLDAPVSVSGSHFVELKKFLVPAPTQRKDLAYVTVDITIELTTSAANRLIKDHVAYYRNIIYDVLKKALEARDKSKINEISLKLAILKAFVGALPERSVKDVIVSTFLMY